MAGEGGSARAPETRKGGHDSLQDLSLHQHVGRGGQSGELHPSRPTPGPRPPDSLGRMGTTTTSHCTLEWAGRGAASV